MSQPFFIYLLRNEETRRSYIGITTDPTRRLRQHRGELAGGARSTRAHRENWTMLAAVYCPFFTRSLAQSYERKLKRVRGWEARLAVFRRLAMRLQSQGAILVE